MNKLILAAAAALLAAPAAAEQGLELGIGRALSIKFVKTTALPQAAPAAKAQDWKADEASRSFAAGRTPELDKLSGSWIRVGLVSPGERSGVYDARGLDADGPAGARSGGRLDFPEKNPFMDLTVKVGAENGGRAASCVINQAFRDVKTARFETHSQAPDDGSNALRYTRRYDCLFVGSDADSLLCHVEETWRSFDGQRGATITGEFWSAYKRSTPLKTLGDRKRILGYIQSAAKTTLGEDGVAADTDWKWLIARNQVVTPTYDRLGRFYAEIERLALADGFYYNGQLRRDVDARYATVGEYAENLETNEFRAKKP